MMADRGKVLLALKQHLIVNDGEECVVCPYNELNGNDCVRQLYRDVEELLNLLKDENKNDKEKKYEI